MLDRPRESAIGHSRVIFLKVQPLGTRNLPIFLIASAQTQCIALLDALDIGILIKRITPDEEHGPIRRCAR